MTALIDFTIGVGGEFPVIDATFEDDNGAVTIQGATVTFRLVRASDDTVVLNDILATNLDDGSVALRGQAEYAWAIGDTATAGIYKAWFIATSAGKNLIAPKRTVQPFLLILVV